MQLNYHRVGSGSPLVLIHGIGHSWKGFSPVLDLLAPERDVIAIDLPGFGNSPPPPAGTPAGVHSLAQLVGEFLDELGIERPHVAGNSLGGWVALELAKAGRAASATGLSPAGFHNRAEAVFQRRSLWAGVRLARLMAPWADRVMEPRAVRRLATGQYVATELTREQAVEIFRGAAAAAWFDQTLNAVTRDAFTGGGQIDVPVTIAWGDHDRLLRPRQAWRAARAIPIARIVALAGCGHLPMYDNPELVARVLLEGSSSTKSLREREPASATLPPAPA
jgi:pimeloyl-ACP methyl ester carboxylesterase